MRIGIAGSYVNGTQKKNSDIDIIIDEDSMRVDIMEYIKGLFAISCIIIYNMHKEYNDTKRKERDNYDVSIYDIR